MWTKLCRKNPKFAIRAFEKAPADLGFSPDTKSKEG